MCGIDEDVAPLYWRIHDGNNDADEFSYDVETACIIGYLRQGVVLVLDNAAIHSGRDNKYQISGRLYLGEVWSVDIISSHPST